MSEYSSVTRRDFLRFGAGISLGSLLPLRGILAAEGQRNFQLSAGIHPVRLASEPFPKTELWCYNQQSPGSELRLVQGEPARIKVANSLPVSTTVHWHGLRIDNAMDGVPMLTQDPIPSGGEFDYQFTPPDAGTYWYHSHLNTAEQLGRGLYGPLIVEEKEPIRVDRDVTWVLDDWRLTSDAQIKDDFRNSEDFSRAGRIGNTITVNGSAPRPFQVRAGERIRLRLINACNARIFSLRFQKHTPNIIALDGQPVTPYTPRGREIRIAPAQRVDLVLDMGNDPGDIHSVLDTYFPQSPFKLLDLVYSDQAPLRTSPLNASMQLPSNPIPEPELTAPQKVNIALEGGDLGNLTGASLKGRETGAGELFLMGKMWAINGVAGFRTVMPPLFTVPRGKTCVLHFNNQTAWPHPMHLHGHHFKILTHDGDEAMIGKWRDTVLLGPGEQAKVAFVADNPGDWLFHCHIVTHAEAGMLAVVRVE
jgi:FtsP/CotA-like multicopper oxidase with cupredoxin domain